MENYNNLQIVWIHKVLSQERVINNATKLCWYSPVNFKRDSKNNRVPLNGQVTNNTSIKIKRPAFQSRDYLSKKILHTDIKICIIVQTLMEVKRHLQIVQAMSKGLNNNKATWLHENRYR